MGNDCGKETTSLEYSFAVMPWSCVWVFLMLQNTLEGLQSCLMTRTNLLWFAVVCSKKITCARTALATDIWDCILFHVAYYLS